MTSSNPQFTPCPTKGHTHPVQWCGAEPGGLRSGVPLHNRMCLVPLRADKTHEGEHRNRMKETWPNVQRPIIVPERRPVSR